MSFLGQVRKKALQANRRIVLPESSDERVIRAASQILKENLELNLCISILEFKSITLI